MKESDAGVRYKVGEVCRVADVQPYVLKYWESEFPVLAPDRSVPGPRTYSARELSIIERIKKLLYDEGYTIAGAKKRLEAELREQPAGPPADDSLVLKPPPSPEGSTARVRKPRQKPQTPAEQPLVFEELIPAEVPAEETKDAKDTGIESFALVPPGEEPVAEAEPSPKDTPEEVAAAAPVAPLAPPPEPPVETLPAIDRSRPPMAQSPDPRLVMAVAELKEILRILSTDPA